MLAVRHGVPEDINNALASLNELGENHVGQYAGSCSNTMLVTSASQLGSDAVKHRQSACSSYEHKRIQWMNQYHSACDTVRDAVRRVKGNWRFNNDPKMQRRISQAESICGAIYERHLPPTATAGDIIAVGK